MLTDALIFPSLNDLDSHFMNLRHIYWRLRMARRSKDVRRFYRQAQKEKARLLGLGFDAETVRLYRLHLKRPDCPYRFRRFSERVRGVEFVARQLRLF